MARGVLSRVQLDAALAYQATLKGTSLARVLTDLDMASTGDLTRAVAEGLGYAYVDLDTYPIDVEVALGVMEHQFARMTMSLAIRREGSELLVACARPNPVLDMILTARQHRYAIVLATDEAVMAAIETVYGGRAKQTRAQPRTLALLFTDIVDSTAKAFDLGDSAWLELLGRHNDLVRRILREHAGTEVNTWGDSFFATFDHAGEAVRAAAAVIGAVRPLGIEVRAGVHMGLVELAERDVVGIAVHAGARIAAMAAAGEVMVSSAVRDHASLRHVEFVPRGDYQLKGVPGSWDLYALISR